MMRRAHRLTALVASLLFSHVLWAGSGFACAMPATAAMPVTEHSPSMPMAGMHMSADMSGMDMAGTEIPAMTGQQTDQGPAHHHAPCEFPAAPDDCQSMTPCAPLALASASESPRVLNAVPSSVAPLVELAPPSRVSPPESPPPRA
jgi:hypothetical protein